MQEGFRQWLKLGRKAATLALVLVVAGSLAQTPAAPGLSQGQAAGQFLRAVLRADYATAYGRLAPEVRRSVSRARFETAARPLWKSGRRRGIELYKLGVRLGDGGPSRLFYAFALAADSARETPSVLFEVTFRDTASRAILGFAVRAARAPVKAPQRAGKPLKK